MPEYQAQLKSWVHQQTGLHIRFSAVTPALRWYGPELRFDGLELRSGDDRMSLAQARSGSVAVDVLLRKLRYARRFGRPLVQCEARRGANLPVDLAGAMVEAGFAVPYKLRDYGYAERATFGAQRYLATVCMLRPDLWRARTDRDAFLAGEPSPPDVTIGACARPAPSRQQN